MPVTVQVHGAQLPSDAASGAHDCGTLSEPFSNVLPGSHGAVLYCDAEHVAQSVHVPSLPAVS